MTTFYKQNIFHVNKKINLKTFRMHHFKKSIDQVNDFLQKNNLWNQKYIDYIDKIEKYQSSYIDARTKIKIKDPFMLYFRFSKINNYNTYNFDIRVEGKSVGTISFKGDNVKISSKHQKNYDAFKIDTRLKNVSIKSEESKKFLKKFEKKEESILHSQEHKIESELLNLFSKNSSKFNDKIINSLNPILLYNCYFQFKTPLGASKVKTKYAKDGNGGSIDLLCRRTLKDKTQRLCIMELKDENTTTEPPRKVMNQAIAYATFIAKLLRSESGDRWYRFFGLGNKVPKELIIDTVIVLKYEESRFENFDELIDICENTKLQLSDLYFIRKENRIGTVGFEYLGNYSRNF